MKNKILFTILAMAAGSLLAADSTPKDDVIAAAKKLAHQSYSWQTSIEMGTFSNTSQGKTDTDGLVHLTMTFNNNTTQAFLKGEKGAVKLPDQDWQSMTDLTSADSGQQQRGARFIGRMLKNYKAPAAQVEELVGKTKDISKDGDVYSADLTEAGAKSLLSLGGRRGGAAPEVSNAKGSVRISIRDGLISKYELRLQGTRTFNGEDRDISGTTTIEIRDVGKTTLQVPEDAKQKLS